MIEVNVQACPQNHPCPAVHKCPEGAMIQDDIFAAPHVDDELCTECGACVGACRVFSLVRDEIGVY
jgi:ferredoxin